MFWKRLLYMLTPTLVWVSFAGCMIGLGMLADSSMHTDWEHPCLGINWTHENRTGSCTETARFLIGDGFNIMTYAFPFWFGFVLVTTREDE